MSTVDTALHGAVTRLPAWTPPAAVGVVGLAACAVLAVVDPNQPGAYPTCPFKLVTGLECPGCGTLRCVHALLRGDVVAAAGFNVLTVTALPFLLVAWLLWLGRSLGRTDRRFEPSARWMLGVGIGVSLFWVLRNIPVEPLLWLHS